MKPEDAEKEPERLEDAPPAERAEAPAPPRAPYVFKILSADPKNSLAFEDVADK